MAKGTHRDKRLTAATVRSLTKPGMYPDGQALYLKIDEAGSKRWVQRLVVQGKRRDIGLGSVAITSLAEAREQALANRRTARNGGDPLTEKRKAQMVWSFEAAAQRVHDLHKPTWRNAKHGQQWLNTLSEYAYPHFGKKGVDAITSADVLNALTPIWNARPETARRVKQRIGTVLKWAIAQGLRTDNPADAISKALPKHDRSRVQHQRAISYEKVGDAIRTIQVSGATTVAKLAFEFVVLTATRSGETRQAEWSEIDLERAEWLIPASRMKAKRPHRVPLSSRCIAILKKARALQQDGSNLIFPGTKSGKPLSDMTMGKLLKENRIDAVVHGFRSSFRDWAGEQTAYPREVLEFALAHVIKDKAEAAYARSDLFDKRRGLMEDWASYVGNLKAPDAETRSFTGQKEGRETS